MNNTKYVNVLSQEGLQEILSQNLQQISEYTNIPVSTLKNYRNGFSNIENMPYHMIESLSRYASGDHKLFNVPSHYIFHKDIFYRVLKKVRGDDYNQYREIFDAQIFFNKNHTEFLKTNQLSKEVRYYFIENLDVLLNEKRLGIDIKTLFSVGLAQGIRFVINLDSIEDVDVYLGNNQSKVVSEFLLKHVTTDVLEKMSLVSTDVYEGIILDNKIHMDNMKLMFLRDYFITFDGKNDPFNDTIGSFLYKNDDDYLLGFILSDNDGRLVMIKQWLEDCGISEQFQGFAAKIVDSFAGVLLSYFESYLTIHPHDKFLVRYA